MLCAGASGTVFPLKVSSTNPRTLADQNNTPFLLVGDAAHSLLANLSQSDTLLYLANRATNGFNSVWVELLCVPYTGGQPDDSLLDGTLPFTKHISRTTNYDLTAPNESYFAYVDTIIRMAATNGIQVMLDPLDTGGLIQTALDNGSNNCRAYGQYLGNRYKNFPNIIWLSGNDFQGWKTNADDAVITAIALGIQDNDTNQLQTVELNYYVSSSLDDTNWRPIVNLNLAYTYYPTYAEVLYAYQQSTNMPVFMGEAHYESESVGGSVSETGTPIVLRHQEYWTLLSGGAGQVYGNHFIWTFTNGWLTNLNTTGVTQLQYATALFAPRAWYNLVPDTNHILLTSGYGTYSTGGLVSASSYATAASTEDGTLALAYVPTVRAVTLNLASMSGTVTAQWYDPANGTYHSIIGSPFSNSGMQSFTASGNNSAGDPDWILVLSSPSPPTGLVATPGANEVVLQWNFVTGATNYNVLRSAISGGGYTNVASLSATNYTDTNVVVGKTYYYVMNDAGTNGTSGYSSEVSAIPVLPPPASPTILPPYSDGSGNVVFSVTTQIGYNYYLESATNLTPPALWSTNSTFAGNGGTITNTMPINQAQPETFFRYLVQ
jgi:hypothetical protein